MRHRDGRTTIPKRRFPRLEFDLPIALLDEIKRRARIRGVPYLRYLQHLIEVGVQEKEKRERGLRYPRSRNLLVIG